MRRSNKFNDQQLMILREAATFSTENSESNYHPDDSHYHHFAAICSSPSESMMPVNDAPSSNTNSNSNSEKKKNCGCSCNNINININISKRMETRLLQEFILFKRSWNILVFCAFFQYTHSIATNVVYYLHVPADQPLRDLGFQLLTPPLAPKDQYISEVIFLVLVIIIVGYMAIQPFLSSRGDGSTIFVINMATRYARVLVLAQTLRIISFLGTILPSPNYRCLEGSETYNPPQSIGEIFLRIDGFTGCGDLIFSSHTIFVTLGGLLIHHYSTSKLLKSVVWMLVVVLGLLVVAARKHYTVDVVVAWYTCPLLWFWVANTYPDVVPPPSTSKSTINQVKREEEDQHNHDDDQYTLQEEFRRVCVNYEFVNN